MTRNFTIPLKSEPGDEWDTLDYAKRITGISKVELSKRALGDYLWSKHRILFPGYKPDFCPYCPRPIEDHSYFSATATEPGGYECPGDDEVEF